MKKLLMVLAILGIASRAYSEEGYLQKTKMKAYEAINKPKGRTGGTHQMIIKNWGDQELKGAFYRRATADEMRGSGAEYVIGKKFDIGPNSSFELSQSFKTPLEKIGFEKPKKGSFDIRAAENDAWQDLVIDGRKVDGVRVWVSVLKTNQ